MWAHIDLSASCSVSPRFLAVSRLALALLRAACLRAKGDLQSVEISGVHEGDDGVDNPFVLPWLDLGVPFVQRWLDSASAADKASLRDLVAPTSFWHDDEQVTAVCRALPLCRVHCFVYCTAEEALPLLRREPPFALLTIDDFHARNGTEQALLDLASALSVYEGMDRLSLSASPLAARAVVDAVVDAAISGGIKDTFFGGCDLSQTALPALGRLLQSAGFGGLSVHNSGRTLFEGPALPAFFEALRKSKSLRMLWLEDVNLWADVAVATQLIGTLEGFKQGLWLSNNRTDGTPAMQRAAGECLARLIARSRNLRILDLSGNALGETGLAPIFQALNGSKTLVELRLYQRFSADFARDVVLPAVRANTSLRKLEGVNTVDAYEEEMDQDPSLREVKDILEACKLADEDAA